MRAAEKESGKDKLSGYKINSVLHTGGANAAAAANRQRNGTSKLEAFNKKNYEVVKAILEYFMGRTTTDTEELVHKDFAMYSELNNKKLDHRTLAAVHLTVMDEFFDHMLTGGFVSMTHAGTMFPTEKTSSNQKFQAVRSKMRASLNANEKATSKISANTDVVNWMARYFKGVNDIHAQHTPRSPPPAPSKSPKTPYYTPNSHFTTPDFQVGNNPSLPAAVAHARRTLFQDHPSPSPPAIRNPSHSRGHSRPAASTFSDEEKNSHGLRHHFERKFGHTNHERNKFGLRSLYSAKKRP